MPTASPFDPGTPKTHEAGCPHTGLLQAPETCDPHTEPLATTTGQARSASVAGYEILGELGHGSMGVVYRARQLGLNRMVALKTIQGGLANQQESLSRFITEARVIARLQHPNIVQVFEISLQRDLPFFSMELVEGGTLAEWLAGRPQSVQESARLILTLARAIHAAHELGIVHRDLKPGNILLAGPPKGTCLGEYVPKITDFGLAKQLQTDSALTQSGVIMGTPNYMAPEQAQGHSRDVGPAADIYALGAILYEMLTGRPPYNAASPAETVLLLFQAEPIAPSRLRPRLPRDLETICLKCLQKDPGRRYESAQHLADDLQRFLNGETILARPPSVPEQAWNWLRRRPVAAALLGSAAVLLLLSLGMLLWHQVALQVRLDEALQEEQQARNEKQQLEQRQRLTRLRAEVASLLQSCDAALARRDWQSANLPLTRARDRLRGETELTDLQQRLQGLIREQGKQRDASERLQRFRELRDQALLEATLFTGSDLKQSLEQTRGAARAALAEFDVTPHGTGLPVLDDAVYREPERREVLTGCYELLLVLAEATAQLLPSELEQDRPGLARQALELLDRADRLGLKTRAIHQRRAHYLLQAGDREGARREQERGAAVPPSGPLDHFLLGQENLHRGHWQAAVTAFEKVLQEQPRHFWGQYYLALCWLKQQRPDLAVPGLTACLGQRADFPWLYLLRGAARGELGQHAEAESDFAAAGKLGGGDSVRYVLLMHRGVLRVRQGQSEQAIADLKAAIALRPKQYQGYVNLSQAYLRAGKLDQAVAELDQAIACAGQLGSLYRTRARVQLLRRQETQALADLERAYQLDRDAPPELQASDQRERARLFLRRKEYARALEACDEALRLQAEARGQRLRAEALLGLGRHAEAAACLDACLQKQPNDVEVLCARASMRTRLGQYQGAQADYSRALELKPEANIYTARGWTYLLTDTPKLAFLDFEAALRLEPDRSDALAGRGLARVQLGQTLQAVQDAQEALRKGPPSARLSYNAARIFAQAALRVDRRSANAEEYTRRALELLEDALNRLPSAERAEFWKNCVQADTVLRPLRWTPSYRRLAALHAN